MKLKHIHIDKYKVFQNFDIDFCHDDQTQSLIVITGVNGSGKTTLLRDVISGSDAVSKPKGYVTVENNGEVETFSLPVSMDNEDYFIKRMIRVLFLIFKKKYSGMLISLSM